MNEINNRLEKMISSDFKDSALNIDKVIKAEVVNVLKNYLILSNEDVELEVNINAGGKLSLNILVNARGVKRIKSIS